MKLILILSSIASTLAVASAATCTTPEKDIDYYGADVSNAPGKAYTDCCDICAKTAKCAAFTWSDYQGGTCWLKSSTGTKLPGQGKWSAALQTSDGTCNGPFPNTDYYGADITNMLATQESLCCDKCKSTVGCTAWTWSNYLGGTCWLKSSQGSPSYSPGKTSGYLTFASKCTIDKDKDYVDNDVGNVPGQVTQCCDLCIANSKCFVWTWSSYNGGTCWFKSQKGTVIDAPGKTSGVTPKQPPKCTVKNGYDLDDSDIDNKPGKLDDCCGLCLANSKCKAWSWSNFNGGTCWLKSSALKEIPKDGVSYGLTEGTTLPPTTCKLYSDTDIVDSDIKNVANKPSGDCCGLCASEPGCVAWAWNSYNGGTCWLKSGTSTTVARPGVVSGVLGSGTLPSPKLLRL